MPVYLAPAISALGVLVAIFLGWRSIRESALRRDDVLAWANEAIEALETLVLLTTLDRARLDDETRAEKLGKVVFDTAILVERGRMFFRNVLLDDYGSHKPPAYRGYRPKILDPLVIAHQIACRWEEAEPELRAQMRPIAVNCLKKFVSLAQKEVGRSRSVSADTAQGGSGVQLAHLLKQGEPASLGPAGEISAKYSEKRLRAVALHLAGRKHDRREGGEG